MKYDPDIHHRRSIRLRGYDYAAAGAYFVTICTHGRECLFGDIVDGEMRPNDAGRVVAEWWLKLPDKFHGVALDEYVVMPNHFHGIVWIHPVGAGSPRPASDYPGSPRPASDYPGFPRPIFDSSVVLDGGTSGGGTSGGGTSGGETSGGETPPLRKTTLGQIVGFFKYQTTKHINLLRDNPGASLWQRNYYERIIRDDGELAGIREYIRSNPLNWTSDEEFSL